MKGENKYEKSREESMDTDEFKYFGRQIQSSPENSNDGEHFMFKDSPKSREEVFENEENGIQNSNCNGEKDNLTLIISKTTDNKKFSIKENLEPKTKFTTTKTKTTKDKKTEKTDCIKTKTKTKTTESKLDSEDRKDNLRDKCWRAFFDTIIILCNLLCKEENLVFKKTNFKQIFGSSIEQNKQFLKLKLYKYLTYNTEHKDNSKDHKQTGNFNKKIIEKMIKKNNKQFIALMKCTIQYLFEQYINNRKVIRVGNNDYELPAYKTIDDVLKEKRNKIMEEQNEKNSDYINKKLEELASFQNESKSLIKHIIVEGKDIQRKTKITKNIKLFTIKELEDE